MKVVQINCSASGSTGNIAKAIHRELMARGDESYIFYGFGQPTEKNMFRVGNDFDLHLHAVLSRNLGKQGYFSFLPTKKLIKQLKKIQPDIVHLHNLHGSYLNIPLLLTYLKETGVKVVVTLHDCWLFTGKCPHFTVAKCYRWKDHCGNCPQLPIYPRSKIDTTDKCLRDKRKWLSGFENRMRILTVSNWLKDVANQSFLSQYAIETLYNGIDTKTFCPQDGRGVRDKYGLKDKYIILGVSSNWNEQKGLDQFLRLAEQLNKDEVIVLVGLSPNQISRMPANIVGITKTENQKELAQLYSAADVFVNLSLEETFGLVTAEAMACNTPVVVYDSTACSEVVNVDCVVLRGDASNLVEAIRTVMQTATGTNTCREHIIKNFSQEKMVRGYLDAYKWF